MSRDIGYELLTQERWKFPSAPRAFTCGYCGKHVSSQIGVTKKETTMSICGDHFLERDIRICPSCQIPTTFLNGDNQVPLPIRGSRFHPKEKSSDLALIVDLYDEARHALSDRSPSCAVLMFRKLLMHIAVEQGAKEGLHFAEYCCFLKDNNILGRPLHSIVERIRTSGNAENHEIRRASQDDANDLLELVTHLIKSVYFLE